MSLHGAAFPDVCPQLHPGARGPQQLCPIHKRISTRLLRVQAGLRLDISDPKTICLRDVSSGEVKRTLDITDPVPENQYEDSYVAISDDATYLAFASKGKVEVYEFRSSEYELLSLIPIQGELYDLMGLDFRTGTKSLLLKETDAARIWDVTEPDLLRVFEALTPGAGVPPHRTKPRWSIALYVRCCRKHTLSEC